MSKYINVYICWIKRFERIIDKFIENISQKKNSLSYHLGKTFNGRKS